LHRPPERPEKIQSLKRRYEMKRILIWALIGFFWGTALLPGVSAAADGRSLYNDKCTLCHGIRGDGRGPAGAALSPKATDFTDPSYWQKTNDKKIADAIKNGVSAMPAFDLKPEEIKTIISYIKTFKK
jgi:mono/diheme cytochrome c family protein